MYSVLKIVNSVNIEDELLKERLEKKMISLSQWFDFSVHNPHMGLLVSLERAIFQGSSTKKCRCGIAGHCRAGHLSV